MNLIKFPQKTVSDEKWFTVRDYREHDHQKIYTILDNMMKNISNILPGEFESKISRENSISKYLHTNANYHEKIKIFMKTKDHEQNIDLTYPKLLKGNYFMLNGSLYVPTMCLERSPIDIIKKDDKKGTKYVVNLLPTFVLTFNFMKNEVMFRKKTIPLNLFIVALLGEEEFNQLVQLDKVKQLEQDDMIQGEKSIEEFVFNTLGLHEIDKLKSKNITLAKFFDEYLILDYFREMFYDFFNVRSIKDITRKIIDMNFNNIGVNMADLRNRRIVLNEYLINPIFEMYLRLLYGAIDKHEKQAFLPTMNSKVILTSGFGTMLHRGQYYNISLPFTNPIINKVSQSIYIVKDGRIPKSWTANHPSAIGKICPISVSADNMGSNLVFTNDTRINYYGRVEI
ncbi:MAG: hypothetical protein WC136_01955 [Sphaerochaeta sp.]